MKNTVIGVAVGAACGLVTGIALGIRCANIRKILRRIESRQIDIEVRLDLLEYNHLHEDGHLKILFAD